MTFSQKFMHSEDGVFIYSRIILSCVLTWKLSLLLHTETADGTVVPVWEEVQPEDVVVLKDIMASRREANDVPLQYNRIPITAEKPPDYSDLKEMIEVVLRNPPNTPIVVNCQLGRGRSTLATVRPAFVPLTKGMLTIKILP